MRISITPIFLACIGLSYFIIPRDFDFFNIGSTLNMQWPHTFVLFWIIITFAGEIIDLIAKPLLGYKKVHINTALKSWLGLIIQFVSVIYLLYFIETIISI